MLNDPMEMSLRYSKEKHPYLIELIFQNVKHMAGPEQISPYANPYVKRALLSLTHFNEMFSSGSEGKYHIISCWQMSLCVCLEGPNLIKLHVILV